MKDIFTKVAKWYKAQYLSRKPSPFIVHLVLTNICNYHCSFCYLDPDEKKYTLPFEKFEELIKELKILGTYYLYLSGGEPLLLKSIEKYLSLAGASIPYIHLVTNGSLLDPAMASLIGRCGVSEISLSLDAMEKTHNFYRGDENAFSSVMAAVENLRTFAPGVKITITTVIAPWNIEEQKTLTELCTSLRVQQRYQAIQEYPMVIQRQAGTSLLTMDFVAQLKEFIGGLPRGKVDRYLRLQLEYFSALTEGGTLLHPIFHDPCLLPWFYVNITGLGDVSPCYGVTSKLYPGTGYIDAPKDFNIFKTSLREIFEDVLYRKMADALRDCQECKRYFASCYIRPRLSFPLGNWIRYHLRRINS
jgi:MoaA/NifB/PqqE/SkfB family radical SAM enzyme